MYVHTHTHVCVCVSVCVRVRVPVYVCARVSIVHVHKHGVVWPICLPAYPHLSIRLSESVYRLNLSAYRERERQAKRKNEIMNEQKEVSK